MPRDPGTRSSWSCRLKGSTMSPCWDDCSSVVQREADSRDYLPWCFIFPFHKKKVQASWFCCPWSQHDIRRMMIHLYNYLQLFSAFIYLVERGMRISKNMPICLCHFHKRAVKSFSIKHYFRFILSLVSKMRMPAATYALLYQSATRPCGIKSVCQ